MAPGESQAITLSEECLSSQIRTNYPYIAWRLEVAARQTKSACANLEKRGQTDTSLIAKGRIPRPLGRDKIVVVRSPPIESESQALPGPPKFGNCIVTRDSGEGKQSVKSVCRGVRHEAALDQWRWAEMSNREVRMSRPLAAGRMSLQRLNLSHQNWIDHFWCFVLGTMSGICDRDEFLYAVVLCQFPSQGNWLPRVLFAPQQSRLAW